MHTVLIDTNILVYAYDRSEPEKQQCALTALDHLATSGTGVLSTQILDEFCSVTLRKLSLALTPELVEERVRRYIRIYRVLPINVSVILEAIRGVREHQFSFWDAQVWATAKLNGIPTVYSEDFVVGAVVEGVRFVNPFEAGERDE